MRLDYHWPVPKDAQLALFEAEIRLALELDKPIIVHDRNAHADVYALLKRYHPKGIVHCYSGSADDALGLAKQGLYFGFGGACTFKGAKRAAKAIAALPLEQLVLETDCPYMSRSLCAAPAATARSSAMWANPSHRSREFPLRKCSGRPLRMQGGSTSCKV